MLGQIEKYIQEKRLFTKSDSILLAVSGGKDSMAMLHALHQLGYKIGVAHINYQLRGEDSELDMQLVKDTCEKLGVEFHLKVAKMDKTAVNVQETARHIRYNFFAECLQNHGYQCIATAHHADDNLETLFIQLMRGTGIHGMKAISPKRENVVRPMLWAKGSDILTFIEENDIRFREDVSNKSDDYLRNRIRHHLIPLIKNEIDETANTKLHTSIDLLSQDAEAVKTMAQQLLQPYDSGFKISLDAIPNESRSTWCYHALSQFGFNRQQLRDLLESEQSGTQILSNSHICVKHKNELQIEEIAAFENDVFIINAPGNYETEFGRFELSVKDQIPSDIPRKNNPVIVDENCLQFPLVLRNWQSGDRFQPIGAKYQVKIADYLKDKGLSILEKSKTIVLENGDGEILWIVGIQLSDKAKMTNLSLKTVFLSLT